MSNNRLIEKRIIRIKQKRLPLSDLEMFQNEIAKYSVLILIENI